MQYILDNEFTAIEESTGTIANISTVPAEISTTPVRGTGIILYPRQVLYFNKNIYAARASATFKKLTNSCRVLGCDKIIFNRRA